MLSGVENLSRIFTNADLFSFPGLDFLELILNLLHLSGIVQELVSGKGNPNWQRQWRR